MHVLALFALAFYPVAPARRVSQEDDARPSLVLVTVDTLRREHLGCYGYPRPTSPRMDALAGEAVLFEQAFASMATTFPSHLTMLTGLYPHQHGQTSNRDAMRNPYRSEEGRLSVAQVLGAAGYKTAAFVSSVVLHERTGIHAGFATYDGPSVKQGKRSASKTLDPALAWLAEQPADEPIFLWIHLWDVHEPNEPEASFAKDLQVDETLRTWVASRGLDLEALARKFDGHEGVGTRFFGLPPQPKRVEDRRKPPRFSRPSRGKPEKPIPVLAVDGEGLLDLYARYDACVREVDSEVGRLVDALQARGTWPRTAFVFTSDHGQSLGEDEWFGHGRNTQLNTAVPLLIRFPASAGVEPGRNRALVSLVDLLPTLAVRLGIEGPPPWRKQFVGRDVLAPDFAREGIFTAEATEFHRGETRAYDCTVVTERWKYHRGEDGMGRLYDLSLGDETRNVASENEAVVRELDALLAEELASSVLDEAAGEPLDEEAAELLRQLEELGYAGGDDEDE